MSDAPQHLHERRSLLAIVPAPQPRHDAVVTLETAFGEGTVRLRYVPDRDILAPDALPAYLRAVAALPGQGAEAAAQTILEDVLDQLIPCWLEVTLSITANGVRQRVRIEDRQPKWQDRGVLDRLGT